MGFIQKLDQSTILKLAAGEIIDRPVSIVKEVVENAIDSGASIIKVHTMQGGIAEIRVEDNGCGIANDDIHLTIEPHATSKLTVFDDVENVLTMGFRGEALASIAEVADCSILSFNGADEMGMELTKKTAQAYTVSAKPREQGTTVTIAHLFKKIPVRFRFLKSPTAEASLITKLIQQFSLHYPSIQFELKNNGVSVIQAPGNHQLKDQFSHALSISSDDVLSFHKVTNGITVSGVLSSPNKTFKQRSKCWFSVNGRMVKSPIFFRAMDQALTDIIPKQTYPALVCNIECNTKDVDINIHPKKEDVKFANQDDIFVAIKRAIQSAVYQSSQTWRDSLSTLTNAEKPTINATESMAPRLTPFEFQSQPSSHSISERRNASSESITQDNPFPERDQSSLVKPPTSSTVISQVPLMETKPMVQWVSFKNKYIIVPLSDHVLVFDQHAVHERILYDRFKADADKNAIISMPLLMPEYVEIDTASMEFILSLVPVIRSLGIDFDVFDGTTFIVREVPQYLSKINMSEWITSWLSNETIEELSNAAIEEKKEKLQMKACKAAVKAGQRLHDSEVKGLIEACVDSPTQFTCPHGRPLYIKMSEHQLDSLFLRS